MDLFKIIFAGRIEFANKRTFQRVYTMYEERAEVHYRNQILLKPEEHFDEEKLCFDLPRKVLESSMRNWKNTISLLRFIADYSISGEILAWRTQQGKKLEEVIIEPIGDRDAIQAYQQGRQLEKTGKEKEAHEAYSKAIEKFERHAMAYERRGYTNMALKKYNDALYDFNKSVGIYPRNPGAYFGIGSIHLIQKEWEKAVEAFTQAHTFSIPHQPLFWKAKRLKGECLMELQRWEEAAKEFKAFVNRKFEEGNSNLKDLPRTWLNYGTALLESGDREGAKAAFQQVINGDEPAKKEASAMLEKLA